MYHQRNCPVRFWLGPESVLRPQLQSFADGSPMTSLPLLRRFVNEMHFIPTAERLQEAEHSIVKRIVGYRKISGPFMSLILRREDLEEVNDCEDAYAELLKQFTFMPDLLAKELLV